MSRGECEREATPSSTVNSKKPTKSWLWESEFSKQRKKPGPTTAISGWDSRHSTWVANFGFSLVPTQGISAPKSIMRWRRGTEATLLQERPSEAINRHSNNRSETQQAFPREIKVIRNWLQLWPSLAQWKSQVLSQVWVTLPWWPRVSVELPLSFISGVWGGGA